MPHKRLFIALLISDAALFMIYEMLKWILSENHLSFRNAVNYTVYTTLAILTLAILVQIIFALFRQVKKQQVKPALRILSGIGIAAIIVTIAIASLNIFIRGVFGHRPEHIVEKDGRTMLARVDSYLQVEVRYYEYVNALVRGSRTLIHEDYGNGGYDPFEMENMPEVQRYIYYDENGEIIKSNWFDSYGVPSSAGGGSDAAQGEPIETNTLDIGVTENRENELVFTISIDDFISFYNEHYWNSYDTPYLSASSEWGRSKQEHTAHSVYETYVYRFSEDVQIWSMPTISVYTPSDCNTIQEVTLDFDDHGYTEALYLKYREICLFSFKVLFPEYTDAEAEQMFAVLMNKSNDPVCFVPDGMEPTPKLLYSDGIIGIYPYYATGVAHICIIPVTEQYLDTLATQGVDMYGFDSMFQET